MTRGDDSRSVADVEGPWLNPDFESSLIEKCRTNWNTPVSQLTNEILSMFLRQGIACELVRPETQKRLEAGFDDDSELYEGQLASAFREASD